jgi:hypothetical protein
MISELLKRVQDYARKQQTKLTDTIPDELSGNVVGSCRVYSSRTLCQEDKKELLIKQVTTADRITLLTSDQFDFSNQCSQLANIIHNDHIKEIQEKGSVFLKIENQVDSVEVICVFGVKLGTGYETHVLVKNQSSCYLMGTGFTLKPTKPEIKITGYETPEGLINIPLIFQKVLQFNAHAKTYRAVSLDSAEIVSMTFFARSYTVVTL